jgi:hypothetical protein
MLMIGHYSSSNLSASCRGSLAARPAGQPPVAFSLRRSLSDCLVRLAVRLVTPTADPDADAAVWMMRLQWSPFPQSSE